MGASSLPVVAVRWFPVVALIVVVLVVWLVLAILGFVIKGLFWLAIVGIVLFLATAALGVVRRSAARR